MVAVGPPRRSRGSYSATAEPRPCHEATSPWVPSLLSVQLAAASLSAPVKGEVGDGAQGVAARVDGHRETGREKKNVECMKKPNSKMLVGREGGASSFPSPPFPPPSLLLPRLRLRACGAPTLRRFHVPPRPSCQWTGSTTTRPSPFRGMSRILLSYSVLATALISTLVHFD